MVSFAPAASPALGQTPHATPIVVIGAGIGGLTAGALLARRGYRVTVLEQAQVPGGCASTFTRRGFTFDVGATQVAGLEPGGIHHRIFTELGIPVPEATPCDPACAVYLPGETEPISVWRDPQRWQAERQRQFPGSEPFWQLLQRLYQASWAFQGRDPILPPRSPWDVGQLLQAFRPDTLITVPYAWATVTDALGWYGLAGDRRLRTFLDLQLKLYSQVDASETALLYAATALAMSQEPQGLWHLQGSMQVLSDRLTEGLTRHGGELRLGHRVTGILRRGDRVQGVTVTPSQGEPYTLEAAQVLANVPAQNLPALLSDPLPPLGFPALHLYRHRLETLPPSSSAFVVYLGVTQEALPQDCPPHLQFFYDPQGPIAENNSLFVSVSHPGDGRAPAGCATITASSFTKGEDWWQLGADPQADRRAYQARKAHYTATALERLGQFFHLTPDTLIHQEAATPRTFARYTARHRGIVGGVGQRRWTFGPWAIATRTPVGGLWLVGDSTHPGEGTAGVSYSALMAVRQVEQGMGRSGGSIGGQFRSF